MSETPNTYPEYNRRIEATRFADNTEIDFHTSDLPSADEARRLAISRDMLTGREPAVESLSRTEQSIRYLMGAGANLEAVRTQELDAA